MRDSGKVREYLSGRVTREDETMSSGTLYTVHVGDDRCQFTDLETAIRTWNALTYNTECVTPGEIRVEQWNASGDKVRDGSILHVQPNGVVYLNPGIVTR